MSTNKNNEYSYDKFLSDSSDDYPKYSDGLEPLTSNNNKPMAVLSVVNAQQLVEFCHRNGVEAHAMREGDP